MVPLHAARASSIAVLILLALLSIPYSAHAQQASGNPESQSLWQRIETLFGGLPFIDRTSSPPASAAAAAEVSVPNTSSKTIVYAVRDGDTLSGIAQHFGASLNAILVLNHLTKSSRLQIGQKVLVSPASDAYSNITAPTPKSPTVLKAVLLSATKPAANNFVTRNEFNAGLSSIAGPLSQLLFRTQQPTVSGSGAPLSAEAFGPSQRIDQLSNVTITNANLTASEIPALNYLSLSGGTVAGNLNVTGMLSGSTLSLSTTTTTSLTVTSTSTLSGVKLLNTSCSTFGNGGKLTTDASGIILCAGDQGGSGSAVAGANGQIQFNGYGSFAVSSGFTFATSTGTLTAPTVSSTNGSTTNATSTTLFSTLANFTSAIANTLNVSIANIVGFTAVNSTTTNATTTNLYAGTAVVPSLSATNATTTSLGINGQTFTNLLGAGLTNTAGVLGVSLAPFTTSILTEGANLYFTNNRVASVIAGTTTDALAEGITNKYFSNARAQSAISVSGTTLTYVSGVLGISQANGSANGYLASADWTNFNNKIASSSLSGIAPISYNFASGAIGFDFTHGNTWTGAQAFANISATNATTTSLYITGITSKLLKTDANGQVTAANAGTDYQAPITAGNLTTGSNLSVSGGSGAVIGSGASISLGSNVVTGATNDTNVTGSIAGNNLTLGWTGLLGVSRGGTGSSTLSGILKGNGTGSLLSAVGGTDYEFPLTFSSPLSRTTNTISLPLATGSANGYLSSIDWTNFNGKLGSSTIATLTTSYIPKWTGIAFANSLITDTGTAIGIGTTTPSARFSISGGDTRLTTDSATAFVVENAAGTSTLQVSTLDSSSNIFEIASSTGSALFSVTSDGNVGVGTTSPSTTFGLVGSHYLTGGLGVGIVNATAGTIKAVGNITGGALTVAGLTILNQASTTVFSALGPAYFGSTATSSFAANGALSLVSNGLAVGTNQLTVSGGNVGIGTTTPGSIFSVNGVANWTGATSTYYSTGGINLTSGCFSINGACITGGGGSGVTSISGTANQITASASTGAITLSLPTLLNLTNASSSVLSVSGEGFFGTASTTSLFISGITNGSSQCLQINGVGQVTGTGTSCGGGGATPGGSNGQIQFNNSGAFGASSNFFWDNTNSRLGIGTTSPYAKLSIHANSGETNTTLFSIASSTASATTTLFSIDNIGNVVSTLAASSTFAIGANGATNPAFRIFASTTNAATGLQLTSNVAGNGVSLNAISSGTNEALTLSSKGTGGINLTMPGSTSFLVNINGGARINLGNSVLSFPLAGFNGGATPSFLFSSGAGNGTFNAATEVPLVHFSLSSGTAFHTNSAIALQRNFLITSTNEGFTSYSTSNTITDLATLSVTAPPITLANGNGTTTNAYALLIGSSTASTMLNASTTNSYGLAVFTSGGAQNTYSAIFKGGNVGIGTTSPWRTLSVTGTVGFDGLTAGAGAGSLCLTANKEIVYSDNAGCTGSSQRFKHNIQTLATTSGLAEVMRLNPVSFIYNNDIGVKGEQVGFIAEEVAPIDQRLVTYDASSTPNNVKYQNMVAVAIKAIQEIGSVTATFKNNLIAWLGSASNGITDFFAKKIHTDELCVGNTCLTESQLQALLNQPGRQSAPPLAAPVEPAPVPPAETAPSGLHDEASLAPVPAPEPLTTSPTETP
jgi:LysM repeat protein